MKLASLGMAPDWKNPMLKVRAAKVVLEYGSGGKTRMVFTGRKTRRAMRAYLHPRHESSPTLFISKDEEVLPIMDSACF